MIALVVFLMSLPRITWPALVVFLVAATFTARWELSRTAPFFDLHGLASNGALARTYLRQALTLLGVDLMMFGLTQWMEAAYGLSTSAAR